MIIRKSDYAWSIIYENISSMHIDDVTDIKEENPEHEKTMYALTAVWQDANRGFYIFKSDSYDECLEVHKKIINAYSKKKKEVVIE